MNFGILGKVFEKVSIEKNNLRYEIKKTVSIFDPVVGFDDIKELFQLSIIMQLKVQEDPEVIFMPRVGSLLAAQAML